MEQFLQNASLGYYTVESLVLCVVVCLQTFHYLSNIIVKLRSPPRLHLLFLLVEYWNLKKTRAQVLMKVFRFCNSGKVAFLLALDANALEKVVCFFLKKPNGMHSSSGSCATVKLLYDCVCVTQPNCLSLHNHKIWNRFA